VKTVRQFRQDRGWTQFELAMRVGVQAQAVYLWESGRRVPQVVQLRKLGQIFDLCSDDIILEPTGDAHATASDMAGASRHPGEKTPGRGLDGRAVTSGWERAAADRDDP
jgi:transcriptional regulator with XRE-family HTH domain